MRVMAWDQSTTKSGWSVWESLTIEAYGLIDWSDKKLKLSTDERFEKMCVSIMEQIKETEPEIVLIEDTTMQRNPQALKLLSRLQGFIFAVCLLNGIEFQIVHPSTWRSVLGFKKAKRDELKKRAMEFVHEELFINDATEDESEALCIGYSYLIDTLKL